MPPAYPITLLPARPKNAKIALEIAPNEKENGMKTVVTMTDRGRITLPASVRKELHIEGETPLELETIEGRIILRPAVVIPREDAWAYTVAESAAIERARRSPIVPGVTEEDLEAINASVNPAEAARDLIARKLHA